MYKLFGKLRIFGTLTVNNLKNNGKFMMPKQKVFRLRCQDFQVNAVTGCH